MESVIFEEKAVEDWCRQNLVTRGKWLEEAAKGIVSVSASYSGNNQR